MYQNGTTLKHNDFFSLRIFIYHTCLIIEVCSNNKLKILHNYDTRKVLPKLGCVEGECGVLSNVFKKLNKRNNIKLKEHFNLIMWFLGSLSQRKHEIFMCKNVYRV